MRFDEWLGQENKKYAKLQKKYSQRVSNARKQDKLRSQTSKANGEKTYMSLVKESKKITMLFAEIKKNYLMIEKL
jgi:hypothetical protein